MFLIFIYSQTRLRKNPASLERVIRGAAGLVTALGLVSLHGRTLALSFLNNNDLFQYLIIKYGIIVNPSNRQKFVV